MKVSRMLGNMDDFNEPLFSEDAFVDLDRSIILCTEKNLRTRCQALCQRGVLYRKIEKLDEARADFEDAASLGSKFARTQVCFEE